MIEIKYQLHTLKNGTYYDEITSIDKIMDLFYYDMFINLRIKNRIFNNILPKSITKIYFEKEFNDSIKD